VRVPNTGQMQFFKKISSGGGNLFSLGGRWRRVIFSHGEQKKNTRDNSEQKMSNFLFLDDEELRR
jgi:hypothetical protein